MILIEEAHSKNYAVHSFLAEVIDVAIFQKFYVLQPETDEREVKSKLSAKYDIGL